ncbi:MAG: hypothetical protein PHQ91_13310 [Thermoanaerobaculaceae bacterium]|nr:hypothetical protein [Thermoanaerobaculaceae bacterium]
MRLSPLSPRVVALSWGAALLVWPLAWLLLAVAQGVGTVIAGGGWIGVAVPLGVHPWGIVNEPTVAFAGSHPALLLYWLAPPLAALAVAVLAPVVLPVPPGWLAEVAVFQLAAASAVLGLGVAARLGAADGPASGLALFWGVPAPVFEAASALLGAVVVQLAVARLASHLWAEPGGPRRSRRLLTVAVHTGPAALVWLAAVLALGWAVPRDALLGGGAVLAGAAFGAWRWTPRSPLHPRPDLLIRRVVAVWVVGVAVFGAAVWAGAPRLGHGTAMVWGVPGMTNNVRPGMAVVRLTPLPAPKRPPAPSAP